MFIVFLLCDVYEKKIFYGLLWKLLFKFKVILRKLKFLIILIKLL